MSATAFQRQRREAAEKPAKADPVEVADKPEEKPAKRRWKRK